MIKKPHKLKRMIPEEVLEQIDQSIQGPAIDFFTRLVEAFKRAVRVKDVKAIAALRNQIADVAEKMALTYQKTSGALNRNDSEQSPGTAAAMRRLLSKLKKPKSASLSEGAYPIPKSQNPQSEPVPIQEILAQQKVQKTTPPKPAHPAKGPVSGRQASQTPATDTNPMDTAISREFLDAFERQAQKPFQKPPQTPVQKQRQDQLLNDSPPQVSAQAQVLGNEIPKSSLTPMASALEEVLSEPEQESHEVSVASPIATVSGLEDPSPKPAQKTTPKRSGDHFERAKALINQEKAQESTITYKDRDDFVQEADYEA